MGLSLTTLILTALVSAVALVWVYFDFPTSDY